MEGGVRPREKLTVDDCVDRRCPSGLAVGIAIRQGSDVGAGQLTVAMDESQGGLFLQGFGLDSGSHADRGRGLAGYGGDHYDELFCHALGSCSSMAKVAERMEVSRLKGTTASRCVFK